MKKLLAGLLIISSFMVSFAFAEDDKVLTVAINPEFPPFEYYESEEDNILIGFDVELIDYIASKAGYAVEYKEASFDRLFTLVMAGEADCAISGITETEQRKDSFTFSTPYFAYEMSYKDSDEIVKSIEQYSIVLSKNSEDSEIYRIIEDGIKQAKFDGTIERLANKYNLKAVEMKQTEQEKEEIFEITDTESEIMQSEISNKVIVLNNAAENEIIIAVNGELLEFTDKPFIDENGRTQIPVREFAESLGRSVYWFEDTKQVTIGASEGAGGASCHFIIGENRYRINGDFYDMDTAAQIVNDRTYVPLRYLVQMMNYEIEYISEEAEEAVSVGIIGGADGPTQIIISE